MIASSPPRRLPASRSWLVVAVALATGCSSSAPPAPTTTGATATPVAAPVPSTPRNPRDVPLPDYQTGTVSIYTSEPGFVVFVDGEPALDDKFAPITTPCDVTVLRGPHRLVVAKEGFADVSRDITVDERADLILEPEASDASDTSSLLKSAYLDAPLSEAIPLLTLNTPGSESDPYISPDGRTIWFRGDRPEGRGIFYATRPSPLEPFEKPVYLASTRNSDRITSPTVSADGLLLVYVVPEKARILAATRNSPEGLFGSSQAVQFSTTGGEWPSAQVLGDGLTIFWAEADESGKPVRTMTATRRSREASFANTAPTTLVGGHPCLSSDGLRQYDFDGRALRRARRARVDVPFSDPEVVASVELSNYASSPGRRNFSVSDDEQWLFYGDDPEGGDLYMTRLVKGRAWGYTPRGKSIPPLVVAKSDPTPTDDDPEMAAKPEVDPRTVTLPYTAHWTALTQLLVERKYDEAGKLVDDALKNPALQADQQLLRWDREDVDRVQAFWKDARDAAAALKPGHPVRLGSAKVDFVKFENDVLTLKAKTKEIDKPITEMSPSDLAALVDEAKGKDDLVSNLRIGAFLYYDPQGNDKGAQGRFEKAGNDGAAFYERLAARMTHQADQEIRRDNAGIALAHIGDVLAKYSNSQAATRAKELSEEMYKLAKWQPIGSRRWPESSEGEYFAAPGRMAGSHLMSTKGYERFELRLEWKTEGELAQGGVFFRWNGEDVPGTANAFKLHLANDLGQPSDMFSTGSLFKVESPEENAVLPEGKWNTLVLRVDGEKVTATINGKKVLDTTATSKEIPLRGYVCLDGEIGGITYRRTLLVELPPSKPAKAK